MPPTVPLTQEQRRAIGPVSLLSPELSRALSGHGFAPLPPPAENDWLAVRHEPGQRFTEWIAENPVVPDDKRRALDLLPLGALPSALTPSYEVLREGLAAFYVLPARLLPRLSLASTRARTRMSKQSKKPQLFTPDMLAFLRTRLAGDAFALAAVTGQDLYPDEAWNYVFGEASVEDRVGVFSFARYDPTFLGEPRGPEDEALVLGRTLRVLIHEVGHMFGLAHCVYFTCIMNGANHLEEADARPLHACPVCLRKLQLAVGFDVIGRYEGLASFFAAHGFAAEAAWVADQLREIRGG